MVSNCLVSDLASISHTVAVAPSLKKVIREEMFYFPTENDVLLFGRKRFVRSGIRTHAWRTRLRPERSALDRSAILTCYPHLHVVDLPANCAISHPLYISG